MSGLNSLGRELRQAREAAAMTIVELSAATGVREGYLTAIEDDREEPSATTLQRILQRLDPAGTSHDRIARLLTAPEFDITGEYQSTAAGDHHTNPPVLTDNGPGATEPPAPDLDEVAAAAARVWRGKSDLQLAAAAASLDEYTVLGRRAIVKELDRRGLARPDNGGSAPLLETPVESEELQFDRVVTGSAPSTPPDRIAVACAVCRTQVETDYYDINGKSCCSGCRTAVQAATETPRGIIPLVGASVFGLGAGVLGAIVYYAVLAIANLEIGIVAILIGYMVGYSVRKGARGGGRRFQILAIALTYASVALAYTPLVFKAALAANRNERKAVTATTNGTAASPAPDGGPRAATSTRRGPVVVLIFLVGFIAALPLLVVVNSLPSGLISAFIIFIGMRQAWRMTGVPRLQVLGPYRVGATPAATPT